MEYSKATYPKQVKDRLKELEKLGSDIVDDALHYDITRWCEAYFNTDVKCDCVDNNILETFNGWILDNRCKAIITNHYT